jgi:hypothetical protein
MFHIQKQNKNDFNCEFFKTRFTQIQIETETPFFSSENGKIN